jgi:hypothetical protein
MSKEQHPMPEHLALLHALAKQAATWWRNQLEDPGYASKFNNGDRSRAGETAQIMASMAALQGPQPASPALDHFEQLLTEALWSRMQRDPGLGRPEAKGAACRHVLSVDYAPEYELRKAAETARVSGFPWKTTMWVRWDADPAECYIEVSKGYGAELKRLPTLIA